MSVSITPVSSTSSAIINQSSLIQNLGISTSVGSNALTITLTQADGSTAPTAVSAGLVKIGFRSATATSGAYNIRSITSTLAITVPSGATLGQSSNIAHNLWVYAIDNSGTVDLGVSSIRYPDNTILSTVAITSGSSVINTVYANGAYSNIPIRLIAKLVYTETTAGTWASNVTSINLSPFIESGEEINMKYTSSTSAIGTTQATVIYPTISYDSHNSYNPATGIFTIPVSGKYKINGKSNYTAVSASGIPAGVSFFAAQTGSAAVSNRLSLYIYPVASVNISSVLGGETTFSCVAGDTISIRSSRDAAITATSCSGGTQESYVCIEKVGD